MNAVVASTRGGGCQKTPLAARRSPAHAAAVFTLCRNGVFDAPDRAAH